MKRILWFLSNLTISEWLLYAGIALMAAAVIIGIICFLVFKRKKKKLSALMDQEYGTGITL